MSRDNTDNTADQVQRRGPRQGERDSLRQTSDASAPASSSLAEASATPSSRPVEGTDGDRDPQRRRRRRGGRGSRDEVNADGAVEAARDGDEAPPSSPLEAAATEPAGEARSAGDQEERDVNRRRGRGRDRNRRDRSEGDRDGSMPAVDDAVAAPRDAPAGADAGPVEVPTNVVVASEASAVLLPAEPTDARAAEPVQAIVAEAPVSVDVPAPAAPAPIAAYALPVDELARMAESSGLHWVNSDAAKIQSARDAMANEPRPIRVPRERKPVPNLDEGPLVLVETRKDLSQLKLPFEAGAAAR